MQPGFDAGHNGGPTTQSAATHFTLGPGAVTLASAISASTTRNGTVTVSSETSTAVDCSSAFVPLGSVLSSSPI